MSIEKEILKTRIRIMRNRICIIMKNIAKNEILNDQLTFHTYCEALKTRVIENIKLKKQLAKMQ